MQKTILQIPMDSQVKNNAEKVASEQGFSSLQEVVRVFLTQLASRKIEMTLQNAIFLSETNDKRYTARTKDFISGNGVDSADSVEELLSKLNENQIP